MKLILASQTSLLPASYGTVVPAIDWSAGQAAAFRDAMNDDFNTAEAIAALFDLANEVNKTNSAALAAQLKALGGILGLLQRDAAAFLHGELPPGWTVTAIEEAIAARAAAKKMKNFAEADALRKKLSDVGIALEDSAAGTTWRRV